MAEALGMIETKIRGLGRGLGRNGQGGAGRARGYERIGAAMSRRWYAASGCGQGRYRSRRPRCRAGRRVVSVHVIPRPHVNVAKCCRSDGQAPRRNRFATGSRHRHGRRDAQGGRA